MKILVVSGFLGAGKTTFIKELIRQTGEFLVVLENEYGENDLDSRELSEVGELEILEFMEGCVCCTKKDSFANTILAISAAMDPEYLVVEPTGVGKLSNIIANIDKVSYERIELLPPVVVLTPRSLAANLRDYPDICRDQLTHAQVVVFSKAENASADDLEQAQHIVRQYNPDARIVAQHYSQQDNAWWRGLLALPARGKAAAGSGNHHGEHDDHNHDDDHDHGDHHDHGHDDHMQQITVKDASLSNIAELVVLLEDALHGSFGMLPRAKGVLRVGGEWMRFDVADGLYGIIAEQGDDPATQCVFIGADLDEAAIRRRLHSAPDA